MVKNIKLFQNILVDSVFILYFGMLGLFEVSIYITFGQIIIRNLTMIVVAILWLIGMYSVYVYPKRNHKNYAVMNKNKILGMSCLLLAFEISCVQFFVQITLKTAGYISFIFQLLSLILLLYLSYYWYLVPLSKSIKKRRRTIILKVECGALMGALISGMINIGFENIFNIKILIMKVLIFTVFGMTCIAMTVIVVEGFITYYYLDKYSRQYRLYYKIPDSIWYFSKEEAEKRNDPVYPPRKKSVEEE